VVKNEIHQSVSEMWQGDTPRWIVNWNECGRRRSWKLETTPTFSCKNWGKQKIGHSVYRLRFEPGTSKIHVRSITAWATALRKIAKRGLNT
jgi:hypothetical protein